ncbi:MAG: NAD(P)(+) transhydrogenase (Re/Si-specific) subunit beta [Candidatus Ancillula sp.]|jgi:NAD(P) transhydrogenase subunit beta|nr:NAD(P)(+) transhydrogenase (Re/Si-specific) subunit beta [Candidatus Ancillula sp.]
MNTVSTDTSLNPIINFLDHNLDTVSWFIYLIAAVLFIQGLRYMNSPKTARRGNFVSIAGMVLACFTAFFHSAYNGFASGIAIFALIAGVVLGAVGGVLSGRKIKMTAMPQLVSIFNTVGGGAAALVAVNDVLQTQTASLPKTGLIRGVLQVGTSGYYKNSIVGFTPDDSVLSQLFGTIATNHIAMLTASLGIFIGCVTFTGSLIAAGKLQGIINGKAFKIPGKAALDAICVLGAIFCGYLLTAGNLVTSTNSSTGEITVAKGGKMTVSIFGTSLTYAPWMPLLVLAVLALIFGLLFALPIGGADMPVVISILNACTGTAVAMSGFVINNLVMIVAGALVGASGSILSILMAKAMNRSLISVLLGGFGGDSADSSAVDGPAQITKETSSDDLAVQMVYANRVIIVPGYGMAVAGAQHEIAELTSILEEKGVEVLFAIHPVAGRMPGHMNVLLAEANISYDKLLDLDEVNSMFDTADVALVVGANDVTNPAARRQGTPISGMPILDVDKAKNVVVVKRGRGKGYAGIENELYGLPQTSMLYGDAKKVAADLIESIKEL